MSVPTVAMKITPSYNGNPSSEAHEGKACQGIDPIPKSRRDSDPRQPYDERDCER
jgi:hypothetical protein